MPEKKEFKKLELKKKLEDMQSKYFKKYDDAMSETLRDLYLEMLVDVNELIKICKTRNKF